MEILPATTELASPTEGLVEREEQGMVVLSSARIKPRRRVLFVNCYGGRALWEKIKQGLMPPHHLWGAIELARMGYEVGLAEPLAAEFYVQRGPYPHDLRLVRLARSWLGREDILYCGHNVLYWLPFLKKFGVIRCHIVSLLYGREPLDFSSSHSGIIALNGAAADHAKKLAPQAKVVRLGWGVDLGFFPRLDYCPESFLSCGITQRDYDTLSAAARRCRAQIRVICPGLPKGLDWPANVKVVDGGRGFNVEEKKVSYEELLLDYYARSAGTLIILKEDPEEHTGCGFTNLIEAMAMGRPVVATRTGALPSEIDIEQKGCGLFVPPRNPEALAEAISTLADDPRRAEAMGQRGRELCESHYNIGRYATELHDFFETL